MAFEEVYDFEILISEIERHPVLYDCSLKEYSDKGLKERLWGKCARAKMEMLGIMRKAKNMVFQSQYAQCFTAATSLPQTYDYNLQYQNTSTVSDIPNKSTVIPQLCRVHYPINHPTFRYLLDKIAMKNEYS